MSLRDRLSSRGARDTKGKPRAVPDPLAALKTRVHERVVELLNQEPPGPDTTQQVVRLIRAQLEQEAQSLSAAEKERVVQDLTHDILGFGPIMDLLRDPSVSEIMVNGPYEVYVERSGKLEPTTVTFRDEGHLEAVLDRMVSPLGRRIDESSPMVDARLPDGTRLNAVVPPIVMDGPVLTLRKFNHDVLTPDDLVTLRTCSREMAAFLQAAVQARLNILVSGGTASGKTTTLNALSFFIPEHERVISIEDAAELQLRHGHWVALESRPPNLEGKGGVSIRDLVRNALRMRPDRILIGEVRGGEALDLLQAMNTGHDGSLSSLHANSPRDALARLETMVLMAGMDLPLRAVRNQIASAIDLLIHQERLPDGSRRLVQVTEVTGMDNDMVLTQDIFRFEWSQRKQAVAIEGRFKPTGIYPAAAERFARMGLAWPPQEAGS